MQVHSYTTSGGKDLILSYLNSLPEKESAEGYHLISLLEKESVAAFDLLDTRQIEGKLWEIKFYRHNRIFYVLIDVDNIYLLHACKKQKGKAENFEIGKAKARAKEIL
ncbi:MAG: type II toxin-antitoxin system RelE/ParE family toxin [Dethiobacteria bacterium]|jgi:phage-related protein